MTELNCNCKKGIHFAFVRNNGVLESMRASVFGAQNEHQLNFNGTHRQRTTDITDGYHGLLRLAQGLGRRTI